MSRAVVLGLALVAGALALLVWRSPAERVVVERGEVAPAEPARAREPQALAPAFDVPDLDETASAPSVEPRTAAGAAQRSAVRDERPRLAGTVRVTGGIPADELVTVRADVTALGSPARSLETTMARDGSFAFVLPEKALRVKLELASRFLLLPRSVMADPGDTGVVLEPDVYAVVEGVVVPPETAAQDVSWAEMGVSWVLDPLRGFAREDEARARRSPSHQKPVRPDERGAFVLAHVPVGLLLELHARNPSGPEWIESLRALEPFEVRRVEIALERGITVSGVVLDEHGGPVEGVWVKIVKEDSFADPWKSRSRPSARTGADGRFAVVSAAEPFMHVSAERNDLVRGDWAIVDGSDGDVHDLVLSVVRGGCIEGTVVWPDRRPAERFEITASSPLDARLAGGTSGRFRLCGLEGAQRVEVRAMCGEVRGTARALAVEPGAAPLELVLEEARAFRLAGTVVDEQGSPIAEFIVRGVGPALEPRSTGVTSSDGTFVLSGLEAGSWSMVAEAKGFQSWSQRVDVGEGTPALRIVLRRGARIRGTVADPSGAPVPGAWVGEESHAFEVAFSGPREDGSDAEGRFEIEASSSRPRILAHKTGFAASEVQALELGPGQSAEGVVLVLRESCRVEGRVLDEHGTPLPGAEVSVSRLAFAPPAVETGAGGGFVLLGLPPGAVELVASHRRKPCAHASATVALVPGHANVVELRFESPEPLRVHGRITRGGLPLEGKFWMHSRSFTAEGASGPDGRFELGLQRAGAWSGAVWPASDDPWTDLERSDVRRFDVSIPDADEHSFDLELEALPRITSERELPR